MSYHLQSTLCSRTSTSYVKHLIHTQKRQMSSADDVVKQNKIFNFEQKRQLDNVGRVDKIEVRYLGSPSDLTLKMNKNISTPYNVAQHISEGKCKSSVVALINNKKLWDMHSPIPDSCTLQLLNFKVTDPTSVNKVFWRSCSFVLGAVLSRTFKPDAGLHLYKFPPAVVKSGSFVHEIALNEPCWEPSNSDLHTLTVALHKIAAQDAKIERLEVPLELAMDVFEKNPFKLEQLPGIAARSTDRTVSLYRVDDHIDISVGPMMASTRFIGMSKIVASHKVSSGSDEVNRYQLQGVALPVGFSMSSFAFNNILVPRARKLNQEWMGNKDETTEPQLIEDPEVPEVKRKVAN